MLMSMILERKIPIDVEEKRGIFQNVLKKTGMCRIYGKMLDIASVGCSQLIHSNEIIWA